MKILFISHRLPYPPNKGDKIRSYNIIRYLAQRHELYLACPIDESSDFKFLKELKPYVKKIITRKIHPRLNQAKGLLLSFNGRPISLSNFYNRNLQQDIDSLIADTDIDGIYCYSSPSAEYLFRSRHYRGKMDRVTRIMDLIDVDSQKWVQYAKDSQWPMKWVYNAEATSLRVFEERISEEFEYIVLVSEAEARLFQQAVPGATGVAVPNGVDLGYFYPRDASKASIQDNHLVFTGLMDYKPNIEAVSWFSIAVFPEIKRRIPDAIFSIVGGRPSSQVKRLANIKGIHVTGYVDDIRDYIGRAAVCVAPLRIARGIQNKVLEAMAMGKTVVCTPQALEGIDAIPDKHVVVAEAAEAFAARILELLKDKNRSRHIGTEARRFVEKQFSWAGNLARLEQLLI